MIDAFCERAKIFLKVKASETKGIVNDFCSKSHHLRINPSKSEVKTLINYITVSCYGLNYYKHLKNYSKGKKFVGVFQILNHTQQLYKRDMLKINRYIISVYVQFH